MVLDLFVDSWERPPDDHVYYGVQIIDAWTPADDTIIIVFRMRDFDVTRGLVYRLNPEWDDWECMTDIALCEIQEPPAWLPQDGAERERLVVNPYVDSNGVMWTSGKVLKPF